MDKSALTLETAGGAEMAVGTDRRDAVGFRMLYLTDTPFDVGSQSASSAGPTIASHPPQG